MAKDIMTIAKRNQAFLLLDRDGVINEERSNYVLNWEQFVFKKDFLENVYLCSEFFDKIFIVTNQSCVGRGLLSVAKLNFIHKKMIEAIGEAGAIIDKVYFSTGIDNSDPRRKPGTAMIDEIQFDYPSFNAKNTVMLGNRHSDMEFAKKSMITSIHYTNNNTEIEVSSSLADWRLRNWNEFYKLIPEL